MKRTYLKTSLLIGCLLPMAVHPFIPCLPTSSNLGSVTEVALIETYQQGKLTTAQTLLWATPENHAEKKAGDPLREATGIRPSLHPVTINAIADALKKRAKNATSFDLKEPLTVAQTAGGIAVEAIQRRQAASKQDGMTLTSEEEQTIAGRVVGVVMRFPELESALQEACQEAPWVAEYYEWSSFGAVPPEQESSLSEQLLMDPLLAMNRAECLLALFLERVERPSLEKSHQEVAGGSHVDFLDKDRKEVLLNISSM